MLVHRMGTHVSVMMNTERSGMLMKQIVTRIVQANQARNVEAGGETLCIAQVISKNSLKRTLGSFRTP